MIYYILNNSMEKNMKTNKKRIEILDELRGFAILAMIVHHFFLDVGDVLDLDWGYAVFNALCKVQPIFWAIFIIISGICSRLSRNTAKRGAIVLGAGLIVTFVTAFVMPKLMGIYGAEIYFGILHCLGVCMIITGLAMPLIEKINPKIGMLISIVLFAATYGINSGELIFGLVKLPSPSTNILMPLGIFNGNFESADYFSIFPWLFMFLAGAFLGEYAKNSEFPAWTYKKHSKAFAFVGRNSLWFYLGHQVVLYALLYAFLEAMKIYYKIKLS